MSRRVRAAFDRLVSAGIPGLCDLTPAYATVLVTLAKPPQDAAATVAAVVRALHDLDVDAADRPRGVVEIPVCYDRRCAPDLEDVARHAQVSPEEVAALHAGGTYSVAYMGFMPGFGYLHGLSSRLAMPRLSAPRPRVPAGSLGIAGSQTGIYPTSTPGGWRLIGQTPLKLFDPARDPATLLSIGDVVRFSPITYEQFRAMNSSDESERS